MTPANVSLIQPGGATPEIPSNLPHPCIIHNHREKLPCQTVYPSSYFLDLTRSEKYSSTMTNVPFFLDFGPLNPASSELGTFL